MFGSITEGAIAFVAAITGLTVLVLLGATRNKQLHDIREAKRLAELPPPREQQRASLGTGTIELWSERGDLMGESVWRFTTHPEVLDVSKMLILKAGRISELRVYLPNGAMCAASKCETARELPAGTEIEFHGFRLAFDRTSVAILPDCPKCGASLVG